MALIWPFFFQRRKRPGALYASSAEYGAAYSTSLETTLSLSEHELDPALVSGLRPILYTTPERITSVLTGRGTVQSHHREMAPFVTATRKTLDNGAWIGYTEMGMAQPALCWRMVQDAYRSAMQETVVVANNTHPPAISSASLQVLEILTNCLCLWHHARSARLARAPVIGPYFLKRDRHHTRLKTAIEDGFEGLLEKKGSRTVADLFFLHSLIPFIRQLGRSILLAPYVLPLARFSQWTFLSQITDDERWEKVSVGDCSGAARLIADQQAFHMVEALAQRWVEALTQAPADHQRALFRRIETAITAAVADRGEVSADQQFSEPVETRLLFVFVRTLVRSWPDADSQEAAFGLGAQRNPSCAAFWRMALLAINDWLAEARSLTPEAIWRKDFSPADEDAFKTALITTERGRTFTLKRSVNAVG